MLPTLQRVAFEWAANVHAGLPPRALKVWHCVWVLATYQSALVRGHLFPIKILRAVHTPITLPGPPWPVSCTHLVTCLDSQWSRFFCANSQPVILPCAFPHCSLILPVFCVHRCVYFAAAVCSGLKKRPKHIITRRRRPMISCTAELKIQWSCLVICCQSQPSCVVWCRAVFEKCVCAFLTCRNKEVVTLKGAVKQCLLSIEEWLLIHRLYNLSF